MADNILNNFWKRDRVPQIDRAMKDAEKICRRYDKAITRSIAVILILIIWLVIADTLINTSSVTFTGDWNISIPAQPLNDTLSRAEARVLSRVKTELWSACDRSDFKEGVVLGPQVSINRNAYMKQVVVMCGLKMEFVNPHIVFEGEKQGVCVDTFKGETKHSPRKYPIVIESQEKKTVTLLDLGEVCMFMNAYDLLHCKW